MIDKFGQADYFHLLEKFLEQMWQCSFSSELGVVNCHQDHNHHHRHYDHPHHHHHHHC